MLRRGEGAKYMIRNQVQVFPVMNCIEASEVQ